VTPGPTVISREQQEDLDPLLGKALVSYGVAAADLVMEAYKLGRRHGEATAGEPPHPGCGS
jgi:hypothetical protein